ncbi:MAG: SPOR domain-containing protein [Pseudomonadota bacterium]|nr:SPOR domain-containing protein [Pseudomonadota bacterium]
MAEAQSWKRLPLFLVAGLFISSCMLVSSNDETIAIDRQISKRKFSVGDEFIFNNPDVRWKVSAVRGGRVHWINEHGDFQITDANPLLSAFYWSNAGSKGRRTITNKSGHLFPMRVGSKIRLRETVTIDKAPYGWDYDWRCEVIERVAKTVPSKQIYVTFKVACSRQSGDTVIFLYAPKVGHYVSVTRFKPGVSPQVRELVSYKHASGHNVLDPSTSSVRRNMRSSLEWKIATSAPPIFPKRPIKKVLNINISQPKIILAKSPPLPRLKPQIKRPFAISKKTTDRLDNREFRKSKKNIRLDPKGDGRSRKYLFGDSKLTISVHLATYKNLENAEAGWRQLIIRHRKKLGTLKPRFVRVFLESRGILYRLHAFPFETRNAASTLCGSLRERGAYCKINGS